MFRNAIYIGKVFGIPLRIHLSWLIIFVLITWSLAGSYYPSQYKDWPRYLYWVVGVTAAVLFFASVLLHELAHSLLARHRGMRVRDIVLFIFGGVSQIAEESKTPGTEFMVAVVGPLTSVVLGVFFLALALGSAPYWEPLFALTFHLGVINIALAVFNLIPGFPLDGGRVLRAFLWKVTGNMDRATQWAARAGQAVGYLFILFGFWSFFRGNFVNGLWLAFIGWFLENAALSSYRQVLLKHRLADHLVDEVMMHDYPTVNDNVSVSTLVNGLILPLGIRCLPVVADGRMVGLVTMHNINAFGPEDWPITTADDVMIPMDKVKTARPDEDLWEALSRMTAEGVNQLPVLDEDRVAGLLTRGNILTFLRTRAERGL